MSGQQIELAINGRFMHQSVTGVQRVARELTREIDHLVSTTHRQFRVRLICRSGTDVGDLNLRSIDVQYVPGPRNSFWEQIFLPFAVGKATLLCLGNTAPFALMGRRRSVALVIHDVSYRTFRNAYRLSYRIAHRLMLPIMLRWANPIFTVSNAERRVLTDIMPGAAERIHVAQNGNWRQQAPEPVALPSPDDREYALYVGSFSQRKNFSGVLAVAIRLAREDGLAFTFVGATGRILTPTPVEIPADVRDKIRFLGAVEDLDQLGAIYRKARCLVFPSFYESSPLPPIEAMHFGCPVVASSIPAMIERCGDAAEYCDPGSVDSIVAAVRRITRDQNRAAELAARGLSWQAQFSWRRQAAAMLDEVERVYQQQSSGR